MGTAIQISAIWPVYSLTEAKDWGTKRDWPVKLDFRAIILFWCAYIIYIYILYTYHICSYYFTWMGNLWKATRNIFNQDAQDLSPPRKGHKVVGECIGHHLGSARRAAPIEDLVISYSLRTGKTCCFFCFFISHGKSIINVKHGTTWPWLPVRKLWNDRRASGNAWDGQVPSESKSRVSTVIHWSPWQVTLNVPNHGWKIVATSCIYQL